MKKIYILFSLLILLSCEIPDPKLSRFDWQVNWMYDPNDDSFSKFLTVFVIVDGIDYTRTSPNIRIERKDLALSWDIPPIENDTDINLGGSKYAAGHIMIEKGLPAGNYTLIVKDIRGPINETVFQVPSSPIPPIEQFPTINDNKLSSNFERAILMVYKNDYFFLMSHLYNNLLLPEKEPGEDFYLYRFSTDLGVGLISGPY